MGTIEGDASTQHEEIPQLEEIITEDGILCCILSKLKLRDAVRTCILSPRWRYIWTNLSKFNFDAFTMFDAVTAQHLHPNSPLTRGEKAQILVGKTDQFIRSVNAVLQQHQGRTKIVQFALSYFLHKIHSDHLDSWIRFAVASKIKKLLIILMQPFSNFEIEPYAFPFQLLGSSSIDSIQVLVLANCSLKLPSELVGLRHLKNLYLLWVHANEKDINWLLSNCSALEKLVVRGSRQLVTLSILHPFTHLLILDVKHCDQLRNIEMSAVNLGKLIYQGVPVDFKFRQSSELRVADICFKTERNQRNLYWYISRLASNLPHLESLKFNLCGVHPEVADLPKVSTTFVHLKRLDWEWNVNARMSLLHLATILDAAPFLEELKLHLLIRVVEQPLQQLKELREMLPKHPHTLLKKIEISGFYFDQWQIQVALYLLSNATQVESMAIKKGREPYVEIHEMDIANLSLEVPGNVKFVIS